MRYSRDGNVLMRPSSDRQYALTVRTTGSSSTGTTKVNHYSVRRNKQNEFYVDIDIKHDPAPTLSEIFERFLNLAGPRNYRAFAPKSIDSGCLPGVNNTEASKLSKPVLPLISNPGSGSSNYVDTRHLSKRAAPVMRSISEQTAPDDYLIPACNDDGGDDHDDYLTTLPDDDNADYLAVCEDDSDVPANRHGSARGAGYVNQNQNVSKSSVSRKPHPQPRRQSEPAGISTSNRLA